MNPLKSVYRRLRWSAFWGSCRLPEVDVASLAPGVTPLEPPITEKLYMAPFNKLKGLSFAGHDDAGPLFDLVRALQPRAALELGTAFGATTANICAVSTARVYRVNALPEQIEGRLTTFAPSRETIGSVYRQHGFAERVLQIYENTWQLDLRRYVPAHSVDFAIIDACHDADFVVNDFLCLLPVLSERAIVLFHDVHPSMRKLLVDGYLGCMYLRKLGYDIRHIENTWWGVWQAGSAEARLPLAGRVANALDSAVVRLRRRSAVHDVKSMRQIWNDLQKPRLKTKE